MKNRTGRKHHAVLDLTGAAFCAMLSLLLVIYGRVQPAIDCLGYVATDNTGEYGSGAFVLAAGEMYRYYHAQNTGVGR